MEISRKRYVAVRDGGTRILVDDKNFPVWDKNMRRLTRQEQVDSAWRRFEDIGQARVMSWCTKNKAISALNKGCWTENVDFEIVEMTETIKI